MDAARPSLAGIRNPAHYQTSRYWCQRFCDFAGEVDEKLRDRLIIRFFKVAGGAISDDAQCGRSTLW
jgi:hypothetical protein